MRNTWRNYGLGLAGLLGLGMSATVHAEAFDFNIGSNTFRGALNGPVSRLFSDTGGLYELGAIVRPERFDDLTVAHLGLMFSAELGSESFKSAAGLGARAVYVSWEQVEKETGSAVAIGGQYEARFPGFVRLGFAVYGFYAPGFGAFGELNQYHEFGSAIDYKFVDWGTVYVGYRNVGLDLAGSGSQTADDAVVVGLRVKFI